MAYEERGVDSHQARKAGTVPIPLRPVARKGEQGILQDQQRCNSCLEGTHCERLISTCDYIYEPGTDAEEK